MFLVCWLFFFLMFLILLFFGRLNVVSIRVSISRNVWVLRRLSLYLEARYKNVWLDKEAW